MSFKYTNKQGKTRHLLNPSEKGRKYSKELKDGKDVFTGKALSDTQKSFRSGYLKSRTDNAKAHNHKITKQGLEYKGYVKPRAKKGSKA